MLLRSTSDFSLTVTDVVHLRRVLALLDSKLLGHAHSQRANAGQLRDDRLEGQTTHEQAA
jgi:hypothetical protein